eukprot:Amastigsp_a292_21.p1 type:complete len:370 gc:universal Amastigsp_a292_21:33-1142(+)
MAASATATGASDASQLLWVDKYRPKTLDSMHYHEALSARLKSLVREGDFPHLLVSGQSGAGKKTRVMALLYEVFGAGVRNLKLESRTMEVGARGTKVELSTISSQYHIELTPSDVGNNDRYVAQEIIKEMAQSVSLASGSGRAFKAVVLNDVDRLSRHAQNSLRRTMEKYSATCRLILICSSTSKVIEPLRSRCLAIRIAAPSVAEIVGILKTVASKEGLRLPDVLAERLAVESRRNLRRALLSLEACRVRQYPFTDDQQIQQPDWELFIRELSAGILAEQSPRKLKEVRGQIYELLAHCIPPVVILRTLLRELIAKLDSELKFRFTYFAALYEHRMQQGSKPIFHLEAFVAKIMAEYKIFLVNNFGGL